VCAASQRVTNWLTDVLPGAVVLGVGLVTLVAPLTATIMATVDPDHVNTASGVNNAVARTASLAGLAVVPAVAELTSSTSAQQITHAYRSALVMVAALAAIAAPIMFWGLPGTIRSRRPLRRVFCAVDGPPVQPDPRRCPV